MRVFSFRTAAAAIGLLALVSCGGNPSSPGPQPGSDTLTVSIVGDRANQSFSPNPAVAAGRLVVFRNNDTVAHRVRLNDLSVDWGTIAPGATSPAFRMPADGTNYHCQVHPTMIGAVALNIETPPPPCVGAYC